MKATEYQKSRMRTYYKNNKDSIKEKRRKYYLNHREEICSRMRSVRLVKGTAIKERIKELHPLIDIHSAILSRCGIRSCSNKYILSAYKGRGISVCEEWLNLKAFESWCLSHGWRKGLQIDRIDNDKGYSPDNCRFVTSKENCRNRRSNHFVVYNGERKTVAEFVEMGVTVLGYG